MAYTPYYAPYARPMGYYNPSMLSVQENPNIQGGQQYQQMPIQQQPVQQMPVMPSAPTNDMLFVLNETEATAYPVAPNNSVTLWDKNKDTVYIKSVNMQGVPSMRILDYAERTPETAQKPPEKHECKCGGKYVSIETFRALQSDFEALRSEIEELKNKPKQKMKMKSEDVNDE
jgi:hypothetical protein